MAIGIHFTDDDDGLSMNDVKVRRYMEEESPPIIQDLSNEIIKLREAKELLKEILVYLRSHKAPPELKQRREKNIRRKIEKLLRENGEYVDMCRHSRSKTSSNAMSDKK